LLRQIIIDLKDQGKVIILSTHLMDFAEKMCDHIAMIDNGNIILNGSLRDIKAKFGNRNVSLNYDGDISFLENHQIVEKIQDFGNTTGITVREESQTQDLLRLLIENDVKIRKFNANDISLHEVFVRLAGDHNAEVINV
jgi:ABC-2 type transport system ATP-binding protein